MKAQQEILTPLLITGIMISIVSSVYLWGVPLIEKNQDISRLQKSEDFMRNLDLKIKGVANTGGKDKITIEEGILEFSTVPFDPANNLTGASIKLEVTTKGTIYSTGVQLPLVRDTTCHMSGTCIIGTDEPDWFSVESDELQGQYITEYYLTFRPLKSQDGSKGYLINMTGNPRTIGKGHEITMEYKGTVPGNPTVANIEIRML